MECGKTSKGGDCKLCKKKGGMCHLHAKSAPKSAPKAKSPSKAMSPTRGMDISDYTKDQFEELSRGKTLLMVTGCFCPPHAGHYGLVKSAIAKIKPDIVVIRSTNGPRGTRHGTPVSHTLETWRDWGKIFSRQYGVYVYVTSFAADTDVLWKSDPKILIELEVYEGREMPSKYIDAPMESTSFEGKSTAFFAKMHKSKDNYFRYHIKREGKLSATRFTKCLKNLTKDCLKYVPEDVENRADYVKSIRERYGSNLKVKDEMDN